MQYDVRVRIQGMPGARGDANTIIDTQGQLTVNRGCYELSFSQYDECSQCVNTSIQLSGNLVAVARDRYGNVVFDRTKPSVHQTRTFDGDTITLTILPNHIKLSQRKGRGYLYLAYDMVHQGSAVANHNLLFEFQPIHGSH